MHQLTEPADVLALLPEVRRWLISEQGVVLTFDRAQYRPSVFVPNTTLADIHSLLPDTLRLFAEEPPATDKHVFYEGDFLRAQTHLLCTPLLAANAYGGTADIYHITNIERSPHTAEVTLSTKCGWVEKQHGLSVVYTTGTFAVVVYPDWLQEQFPEWETRYRTAKDLGCERQELADLVFYTTSLAMSNTALALPENTL